MTALMPKSGTSQEAPPRTMDSDAMFDVVLSEPRAYTYEIWHHGMWYGMATAACSLLLFCALMAGLTLALCGLEMTWLKMRGVTGTPKERNRALIVAKMKRHSTWMLCSLIICSVAAGESFPFLIQGLWHGNQLWVPILISTLSIALFAEILPQYIIPRNAINWGYFCSPIIWSCMFLTGIVSYPLALLLDALSGNKEKHEIFSNDEMAALIKYHERSEKHGGNIDQNTARIMLGALDLNSRKVGGDISRMPEDVEKVDSVISHGLIVQWSAVKTIDIDEPVDGAFISKVKSWSYSRIPVTGDQSGNPIKAQSWEGKQIFGFLHIKNLLGLEIDEIHDPKNGIFVRDLPLYPLPIIQEQVSIYELLDIFQLGMSRMAVVVPRSLKSSPENLAVSPKHGRKSPESRGPCWTATQRTNARIVSRMKTVGSQADWTTDWATGFLDASQIDIQNQLARKENVVGVKSPKPAGIITFEDIIDTILQKTSRDERDFFDRDNTAPPTKKRKAGDFLAHPVRSSGYQGKENSSGLASIENSRAASFQRAARGTVRKRKVSKPKNTLVTMDGADDRRFESANDQAINHDRHETKNDLRDSQMGPVGWPCGAMTAIDGVHVADPVQTTKNHTTCGNQEESSSTQSCQGGFHSAESSTSAREGSAIKTASLPSRRGISTVLSDGMGTFWRNVSASPALPQLKRVTPFSRENYSRFEKLGDGIVAKSEMALPTTIISLGSSSQVLINKQLHLPASRIAIDEAHGIHEEVREVVPEVRGFMHANSCGTDDLSGAQHRIGLEQKDFRMESSNGNISPASNGNCISGSIKSEPYSGFPAELLDSMASGRVNGGSGYVSKTLPRMMALAGSGDTSIGEQSFHDDSTLLPSQNRVSDSTVATKVDGMRCSSFWV